jgi:hypothetical protein
MGLEREPAGFLRPGIEKGHVYIGEDPVGIEEIIHLLKIMILDKEVV